MTIEMQVLGWSIALGFAHIAIAAAASTQQRGLQWTFSSRDDTPPLTGVAARLERAQRNFLETFPFFAVAALCVQLYGRHSHITELGAQLYFWARVAYLPVYAAGIFLVRSVLWAVATAGIVMLLIGWL